jgi:hypothetical protein
MQKSTITRRVGLALGGVLIAASLTGCDWGAKASEPYKDAKRDGKSDTSPAKTGSMPDGFSNYATKCIADGIRLTVAFHGDAAYSAISTVADPNC